MAPRPLELSQDTIITGARNSLSHPMVSSSLASGSNSRSEFHPNGAHCQLLFFHLLEMDPDFPRASAPLPS